ncbi:MAG: hypothetical protein GF383_16795 [Candidatus Lokiarchaeota archaeon]|nr:hypothetical protein [Candidatus Lokiarchaeota archaeon]
MDNLNPKTIIFFIAISLVTGSFGFVSKYIIDSITKVNKIGDLESKIEKLNENIEQLNKKLGSTDFKVEINENEIFYIKGKLGVVN